MYNPATQVQVSIDANLGSYFQKNKIEKTVWNPRYDHAISKKKLSGKSF
jgi:hypothetical protein